MSNVEQEDLFRKAAEGIIPESLQGVFEQELENLIAAARRQIELRNRIPSKKGISFEKQTELTLQNWTKEKLVALAYERYTQLMEQDGQRPITIENFKLTKDNMNRSPYKKFEYIEQSGIRKGSKIVGLPDSCYKGKTGIVDHIQPYCTIAVNGKSLSPFHWKLADTN